MVAQMFVPHLGPAGLVIPNLVAHWPMDDGTGTSVADASGNGRTGTASGTPTWGTGQFGGCLNFDGIDDYVNITSTLDFAASQDFTISMWVKTSTAAPANVWPMILTKRSADGTNELTLFLSSSADPDVWYFSLKIANTAYTIDSAASIRNGNWHHLVCQREGTTIRSFQDNVQAGTTTNAAISGSISNTDGIFFGKWNIIDYEYWYTGDIDDLRIYNHALTTTEIAALYNGTQA